MRHEGLSLDKQKTLAWEYLNNYACTLLNSGDYDGVNRLIFSIQDWADGLEVLTLNLRSAKRHRKQGA